MVEIKCLENKKDSMRIELSGRNHLTMANILNENIWQIKGAASAFVQKHPQIPKTELVVHGTSPKTKLVSAAEKISKDAEALKKYVK